jgi:hypothetical protein
MRSKLLEKGSSPKDFGGDRALGLETGFASAPWRRDRTLLCAGAKKPDVKKLGPGD